MTDPAFAIRSERPGDEAAISSLNDKAFGPGRYARSAYRLREGRESELSLAFVGEAEGALIGSVRMTRIQIGRRRALLLGPLVVDPAWKDRGCGKRLVRAAVAAAADAGHELVVLVGDQSYYGPLGFKPIKPPGAVKLPGPVDPARLLVAELAEGAADGLSGLARAVAV